jgi:uncharacterized protein (TIGR02611 family)
MLADVKDLARLLRRIAVTAAGTVILVVGLVLLAAPGPGLVVIAVALAVFAIEYEWARRRLAIVRDRARSVARQSGRDFCAVLFGVAAIGLGAVLIFTDVLPMSGAGTGAGAAVAGVTVLATVAYSVWGLRRAEKADEDERAQPATGSEEPGGSTGESWPGRERLRPPRPTGDAQ